MGKDAPSHASEYAHPDIAIGLATLAYRYEGLRPADFGAAIHQLRAELDSEVGPALKRPASLQWIRWVQAVGKRVRGNVGQFEYRYYQIKLDERFSLSINLTCLSGDPDIFVSNTATEPTSEEHTWKVARVRRGCRRATAHVWHV